eukprot:m.244751 g.244751  ORF g.244751 m.244751 type:complete len:165 (+) comp22564_c3_seq2:683-1177(+)
MCTTRIESNFFMFKTSVFVRKLSLPNTMPGTKETPGQQVARILIPYAVFLFLCGFGGWAINSFAGKAKSGMIMGSGSAVVVLVVAWFARRDIGTINLSAARQSRVMGSLVCIIYSGVFVWRASKILGVEEKVYLFLLLCLMVLGSVVTLVRLLWFQLPRETHIE